MKVPFLDLRITDKTETDHILGILEKVLNHGKLVMGPEIELFESKVAAFCSRQHAVSVGSGTDSLYLALRALRIGSGDEVITTSLSWIATANAIALTGATPVFADINEDLNINPDSVKSLVTSKTKAILAVNYTGKICDMDSLTDIAKNNNLFLIEDGSQSFGAKYKGNYCGSFGIISGISHNPMKVFAALGEAGTVLCNDAEINERLISLRYNGTVNRETCMEPSLNGRMDTLHAAVLIDRLDRLNEVIYKRRANAAFYKQNITAPVRLPFEQSHEQDVFYTFTIQTSKRDELRAYLEEKGIETKIQHQLLMPQQPAYRDNTKGKFTNAEKIVKEVLCIPIHEKLTQEQLVYVASTINTFFK